MADDIVKRLRALIADKGEERYAMEGDRWLRHFIDETELRVDALTDAIMEFFAKEARRG